VLHLLVEVLALAVELLVQVEDQVVVDPCQLELEVVELLVRETMVELVVLIQEDQAQEQITVVVAVVVLLQ
tara:strand:+ start:249 stop:461 length:213 start_codon:yes stop_codon:yes gene_type:complete